MVETSADHSDGDQRPETEASSARTRDLSPDPVSETPTVDSLIDAVDLRNAVTTVDEVQFDVAGIRRQLSEIFDGVPIHVLDPDIVPSGQMIEASPLEVARSSIQELCDYLLSSGQPPVLSAIPVLSILTSPEFVRSNRSLEDRVRSKAMIVGRASEHLGKAARPLISRVTGEALLSENPHPLSFTDIRALITASRFCASFERINMPVTDEPRTIRELGYDVYQALTGRKREIELLCTTCPDYEYDADCHYQTEGGLRDGVSLSAKQLFAGVSPLLRELTRLEIPHRLLLAFADLEADDPDMREKVGLSQDQFFARVRRSMEATHSFVDDICIQNGLLTDIEVSTMSRFMEPEVLSSSELPPSLEAKVEKILEHRRTHYREFFPQAGGGTNEALLKRRAKRDVREHFSLGRGLAMERAGGRSLSVVTSSKRALSRLFNRSEISFGVSEISPESPPEERRVAHHRTTRVSVSSKAQAPFVPVLRVPNHRVRSALDMVEHGKVPTMVDFAQKRLPSASD